MYIRTKDGIYKVESTLRDNGIVKGYNVGEIGFIRKDQVIKQSENLEELCDEFVVFDKEQPNGKLLYYKGFENLKKEFIDFEKDKEKVVVCGAIWTDKGLIYVAKMNSTGELELLDEIRKMIE